jgi:hypothetical protein
MIGLLLIAAAQGWTVYASGDLPKPRNHIEFYDRCVGSAIVKLVLDTELPADQVLNSARRECWPKAQAFKPQLKRRSAERRIAEIDAKYAKTVGVFIQSLRTIDEPPEPENVEKTNAQD